MTEDVAVTIRDMKKVVFPRVSSCSARSRLSSGNVRLTRAPGALNLSSRLSWRCVESLVISGITTEVWPNQSSTLWGRGPLFSVLLWLISRTPVVAAPKVSTTETQKHRKEFEGFSRKVNGRRGHKPSRR